MSFRCLHLRYRKHTLADQSACNRKTAFRYYSHAPEPASLKHESTIPEVTIIRPCKGLEPYLYDCLASTFRQDYAREKLHIRLCIASRSDPALPVLESLVKDFGSEYDVQIFVEEEDELLQGGGLQLGPNPKIRNMSRAYREADRSSNGLVWIVDCNVWIGIHTLGRMIRTLEGNKFVHQLPLSIDVTDTLHQGLKETRSWWSVGGSRLDEMFMSTAHAKFYTAINTVLIAPCIVGKSTMFPTSYLDSLTEGQGIDYFSYNICEDHLIGDLLWKGEVPEEKAGSKLGKHAMCFGDLAIQPMVNTSVSEYWNRRVRWLRVRKFTVTLATLVEPGTESFLCSTYGAYAVTSLPFFHESLSIPQTWAAFAIFWLISVSLWCAMDWTLYRKLHSGASVWTSSQMHVPEFAKHAKGGKSRPLREWLMTWIGREALALPIWAWAFYGGTAVQWRGKSFWVGTDMKVHEIESDANKTNGHAVMTNGKARYD
ncbi:Ceramide glucosyltransferase [Saxophila tyrrhenica]|uniref:Ceramide glucosyltransferase n=1 Tax=Saxophila tyrrhenica TaxID=1690608 RepID=A0AAV9P598_9PEZI|nr:Ceramide glucosyltransferase [Saxophila tyrrhenica]